MATRIQRDFTFQAGVYFQEQFYMNVYDMTLSMSVETDNLYEQNIAISRIKCFLAECLENSIFVQDSEKKVIDKYRAADLKVSSLPEEPYDQIICLALICKLNAILEGRLIVDEIEFGSDLSDEVRFTHYIDDSIGPFEKEGWWRDSGTSINDFNKLNKKEKIVKLIKNGQNDWAEFGLLWKEKSKKDTPEIIFTTDIDK